MYDKMSEAFDINASDEALRKALSSNGMDAVLDKINNGEEIDLDLLNASTLGDEKEHLEGSLLKIDENVYVVQGDTAKYFQTAESSEVPRKYIVHGTAQNNEIVEHIIDYLEGRRLYTFDEEPQLLKVNDIADLYDFTAVPESYHEICARNANELECPQMFDIMYKAFLQYLITNKRFPDQIKVLKYFTQEQLEFMSGFAVESVEPPHRRSYEEIDLRALKLVSIGWPRMLRISYAFALLYHCKVPLSVWSLYLDVSPKSDSEFREICARLVEYLTDSELVAFIKDYAISKKE